VSDARGPEIGDTSIVIVPSNVLAAYDATDERVVPLAGGLINETFLVGESGAPKFVLQKLHKVFEPTVNIDIDVVTKRLKAAGLQTPLLVRTTTGARSFGRWRALTFVPGLSCDFVSGPEQAESAAALIGRFHAALDGWDYTFAFVRHGVHDTKAHLGKLRAHLESSEPPVAGATELAARILGLADGLPALPTFGLRICHGDLKISNLRFASDDPNRATCLLDLDTIGLQSLAYELGDAMRSWCNRSAEDAAPNFDRSIFAAALRGYRRTMPSSVTPEELATTVVGTVTVCVELAARFCSDVFDDSYFGWDATRYPSRRAHNLARAASMADLATQVHEAQNDLAAML